MSIQKGGQFAPVAAPISEAELGVAKGMGGEAASWLAQNTVDMSAMLEGLKTATPEAAANAPASEDKAKPCMARSLCQGP